MAWARRKMVGIGDIRIVPYSNPTYSLVGLIHSSKICPFLYMPKRHWKYRSISSYVDPTSLLEGPSLTKSNV
ncbi:unnamed protein product [Sphenostylis stenocarpa]|uniref:Uncharacterized protein n=1 Tax=Sphenostylis stenocarpa TaxID=92480 RepID=A0AA86SES1_9FABA|nr:unnamed protein product [Sphenostylis stenocarpa]